MKTVKGCFEIDCISNEKKRKFKKEEKFCPYCGKELHYVCKSNSCHTMLPDDTEEYCVRCKAKIEDKKIRNRNTVLKIGGAALTVGTVTVGLVKKGIGTITKK